MSTPQVQAATPQLSLRRRRPAAVFLAKFRMPLRSAKRVWVDVLVAGVLRHHPELHRPCRPGRDAADPGQGDELVHHGLRQHQLLVPGRLCRRLPAAGPPHRQGRRQARLLPRRAAVEPGHRRPRSGDLRGRLHDLPLHPRPHRGGQLPGLREDHPPVVPRRRARPGHRHLQRRHQRRRHGHPGPAAADPVRLGLAGRLRRHRACWVWSGWCSGA